MKKLSSRELKLFYITLCIAIGAVVYVFLLEPFKNALFLPGAASGSYKKAMDLLSRKQEIEETSKNVFSSDKWKDSAEEQQVALQVYIEQMTKSAGVSKLMSIYPLTIENRNGLKEISLQIEMQGTITSLTNLLYKIGTSNLPLKVNKINIFSETEEQGMLKSQIEIASVWFPSDNSSRPKEKTRK